MQIMDDEAFGANTVCNRDFALTPRVITAGTPRTFEAQATCGGGIGAEVTYTLTDDGNGVVRATGGFIDFFGAPVRIRATCQAPPTLNRFHRSPDG